MDLKTLKALSLRAAPLLAALGDGREQFLAEEGENYTGLKIDGAGPYPHPLSGTPMVGGMSGYYEPEWDEQTTYESLLEMVRWHFVKVSNDGETWKWRDMPTPEHVFSAAAEMLADLERDPAESNASSPAEGRAGTLPPDEPIPSAPSPHQPGGVKP